MINGPLAIDNQRLIVAYQSWVSGLLEWSFNSSLRQETLNAKNDVEHLCSHL
jgi:hypothetical protein